MNCPKCQTEISVAHKYCHECGENLMVKCPYCRENDFNKAVNLCEKKIKEAQKEEIKADEKINKLQAIFNAILPTIFLISLAVPFISRFIFNKTIDILIPFVAGGALGWVIYVILRAKMKKIMKDFVAGYPEYYAAKNS